MELTIEQALEWGVTAHKEGKLDEAESFYRAILQSQPLHPDANHNLGVIAVSVNKAEAALPLFKTALEANPKIEQFWLSYIDALIKDKQFDNAKDVIELVREGKLVGDKVNALEEHLTLISETPRSTSPEQKNQKKAKEQNLKAINSPEAEIKSLLEYYQNEQYGNAEQLALSITEQFPEHQFSWKVLGAVLKQTGRISESLVAMQKSVQLQPQDAEAHSNLGIMLQEQGRLDEAEVSLRQAITLKSDYAEAQYNLGVTLKELARLEEAIASYAQAIVLKPDYAEAHSNLGNTLKELGRLDEAEVSYKRAITLKPELAEGYNNLGVTLQELGRLDEAVASLQQAIMLKPDYAEAMLNLSISLSYTNDLKTEMRTLKNSLQIDSGYYGLKARVNLAICNFLDGNFLESKKHILAATKIQEITSSECRAEKAYQRYLLNILKWCEDNYFDDYNQQLDKTLYVIGESHSLASHYLRVQRSESDLLCKAKLIKGCKQWHLGNSSKNKYKSKFESIFCSLPKSSEVLLTIGEIDCRLDSGFIKHKKRFPEKEMIKIILTTVENYLTYVVKNNFSYQHNIIIQGVPCPNIDIKNHPEKNVVELIEVIKKFNCELKNKSTEKGFEFLDVHKLTDRGDGLSNAVWHIDDIHLSPDGMLEAWRRYASEQKQAQCFKV